MKSKFYFISFILILLGVVSLTSCSEDEEMKVPEIKLQNTSVEVDAEGGLAFIEYELINPVAGEIPAVKCDAEWVSGFNLSKQNIIEFTVSKNQDVQHREVVVAVTYPQMVADVQFTISQDGYSAVKVTPEVVEAPYEGGDFQVFYSVDNPVDGGVLKAVTAAEWIGNIKVSADKIEFSVAENTAFQTRKAEVELTYQGLEESASFSVEQEAAPYPELALDKESIEIPAEGGNGEVGYSIAHPVEGVEVKAECTAEWVSGLKAENGVISFSVAANPLTEARSAEVAVSYKGAQEKATFRIDQLASVPCGFTLEIYDIQPSSLTVNITPDDKDMMYLYAIQSTDIINEFYPTDDALFTHELELLRDKANYSGISLSDYLKSTASTGDLEGGLMSGLTPETKYTVYVYGIQLDENDKDKVTLASDIFYAEATTAASQMLDVQFSFDIKVTGTEVEATVTPTSDYKDFFYAEIISGFSETATVDELTAKIEDDWMFFLELYLDFGYTPEAIMKDYAFQNSHLFTENLDPEKVYYAVSMCLGSDGLRVSEISYQQFHTEAIKPSGNVITISIENLKPYTAQMVISTTTDDPYTYTYATASEMQAYTTDAEIIDHLLQTRWLYQYNGGRTVDIPIECSTDYYAYAFGYKDGKATTELVKVPFRSPDPIVANIDVKVIFGKYYDAIEVMNLAPDTWNYAPEGYAYMKIDTEMNPSGGNTIYWSVLDPSYIEGATDDEIVEFLLGNGHNNLEEVMEFEYDTQIQAIAVGVDADGNRSKPFISEILTITREGRGDAQEFVDNVPFPY